MKQAVPFLLSESYVQRVGLLPSDIGKWCLLVESCHHVFENEDLAKRAYALLLDGVSVR